MRVLYKTFVLWLKKWASKFCERKPGGPKKTLLAKDPKSATQQGGVQTNRLCQVNAQTPR